MSAWGFSPEPSETALPTFKARNFRELTPTAPSATSNWWLMGVVDMYVPWVPQAEGKRALSLLHWIPQFPRRLKPMMIVCSLNTIPFISCLPFPVSLPYRHFISQVNYFHWKPYLRVSFWRNPSYAGYLAKTLLGRRKYYMVDFEPLLEFYINGKNP